MNNSVLTEKELRFIRGYEIFNNWDCDIDREIFEESYFPHREYYLSLKKRDKISKHQPGDKNENVA